MRRRTARLLKMNESFVNVQEENPVAYDSQANGGIEVDIELIRGLYGTLKFCFESRIGKYVTASHPICAWLLQHACVRECVSSRHPGVCGAWASHRQRHAHAQP